MQYYPFTNVIFCNIIIITHLILNINTNGEKIIKGESDMRKSCISKNWYFKNTTDNTDYEVVDLPHDYQIAQPRSADEVPSNGFYPNKTGRYVKHFNLQKGKHYILDVDGAYMCTNVEFNENFLLMHPYGYTPFLVDLTDYVREGTDKLVITTSPQKFTARWYSGNGLYRDVFLWEGGEVRIEPWDLFVYTQDVKDGVATIKVKYTVSADKSKDVGLKFSVYNNGEIVKTQDVKLKVKKGKNQGEADIEILNPLLWNVLDAHLYTLKAEILCGETVVDEFETEFGIKKVTADVENGLVVNGNPIKLKGGCIHHDHGDIGSASFPASEERKIRKLIQAGFNSIRCAHNPPSLALLQVCDRLGVVVMDEAFDCWNIAKPKHGYNWWFADWWARDIASMVLRDRNHPCVFSYSIGNEVLEVNGTSNMKEWAEKLAHEVKKYDDTKFVTSGLQKYFVRRNSSEDIDPDDYKDFIYKRFKSQDNVGINKIAEPYENALDIVGLNYYYSTYELDHKMHPNKVIWGSETQAIRFYQSWEKVEQLSYVLGDYTWTAYDNMGEVGAGRFSWARENEASKTGSISLGGSKYPWRNCFQGDLDSCGVRRPQSYFREAIWRENTEPRIFVTHPEHFGECFAGTDWHWYDVEESWTYDDMYENSPIKAQTYTKADEIKWYVNGEYVGSSAPINGIATIETVYKKGCIKTEAYKNGNKCGEYTLYTTGNASKIKLEPEKAEFFADNRDLCYIPITLTDTDGKWVVGEDKKLRCKVLNGELLAFFSGDPKPEQIKANECVTFRGTALAVVRAKRASDVYVTVYGEGLAGCSVKLKALSLEDYEKQEKKFDMISLPIF